MIGVVSLTFRTHLSTTVPYLRIGVSKHLADANFWASPDGFTLFSGHFGLGNTAPCNSKNHRHCTTWKIENDFAEHSCFPGPPDLDRFAGQATTTGYQGVQYGPNHYGQYIDLWRYDNWKYVRTLSVAESSGFCGTHHISYDNISGITLVDVHNCSPQRFVRGS